MFYLCLLMHWAEFNIGYLLLFLFTLFGNREPQYCAENMSSIKLHQQVRELHGYLSKLLCDALMWPKATWGAEHLHVTVYYQWKSWQETGDRLTSRDCWGKLFYWYVYRVFLAFFIIHSSPHIQECQHRLMSLPI